MITTINQAACQAVGLGELPAAVQAMLRLQLRTFIRQIEALESLPANARYNAGCIDWFIQDKVSFASEVRSRLSIQCGE